MINAEGSQDIQVAVMERDNQHDCHSSMEYRKADACKTRTSMTRSSFSVVGSGTRRQSWLAPLKRTLHCVGKLRPSNAAYRRQYWPKTQFWRFLRLLQRRSESIINSRNVNQHIISSLMWEPFPLSWPRLTIRFLCRFNSLVNNIPFQSPSLHFILYLPNRVQCLRPYPSHSPLPRMPSGVRKDLLGQIS